jgi:hypothetical protein
MSFNPIDEPFTKTCSPFFFPDTPGRNTELELREPKKTLSIIETTYRITLDKKNV